MIAIRGGSDIFKMEVVIKAQVVGALLRCEVPVALDFQVSYLAMVRAVFCAECTLHTVVDFQAGYILLAGWFWLW
jgi:hypothetical protein